MIRIVSVLLLLMWNLSFFSQEKVSWKKVEDYSVTYEIPEDWSVDSFTSSSVCDCVGSIISNNGVDEEYLGMVIYPCESSERLDEKRSQIWGYEFVSEGPEDKVKYSGIEYKLKLGSFKGMKNDPVVWKFYSIGEAGRGKKQLVVYFFGDVDIFQDNTDTFKSIMDSMKRVKV